MSADIVNAEAVGKVIVPESIPAAAANQTETDKAAVELRKTLDEKGADITLKSAAERRVDQNVSSHAIDENIGSKRDDEGKMVREDNTPEKDKHDKSKKMEAITVKYLDKGYDVLNNSEKTKITSGVEQMILTYPALRAQYEGLDAAAKKAYLEKVARDPKYSKFVAEWMNGVIDPAKIKPETISILQQEVTDTQKRIEKIDERLTNDSDNLEKNIKQLKEDLEEYRGSGGSKKEVKIRKIDRMRASLTEIDGKLEPLQEERDTLNEELKKLKKLKTNAAAQGLSETKLDGKAIQVKELDNRISSTAKSLSDGDKEYKDLLAKKQALTSQITRYDEGDFEGSLKKELDEALKEKKDLEKEKTELNEKLTKKKLELSTAKTQRTFDEEQFVKNLEGTFTEAAAKYFNGEINKAESEMKIYLEKKAVDLKAEAEAALSKGLLERYYPNNAKKINAEQVVKDKESIITTGPEAILIDSLKKGGYNDEQITKLQKDKAKWNELMGKTAEVSLKYYWLRGGSFHRGGKMNMDEQIKIMESPWGKEVIKNSVTAAKAQIETALHEKLPESSKLGEWFRKIDMKKWLIILAILAGLGILGFTMAHK